jgi:prepilin-type N-terminal cleavage/methylation domain-containing protein
MRKNKGFTLIELLVVIAIIGILSAIVLASLNSARNKAKDAKIQGQMSSTRAAAEIAYSTLGNKYNTAGTAVTTCDVSTATQIFADSASGMKGLVSAIINDAGASNYDCGVAADGSAWSIAAKLNSGYFCVDSTGVAKGTQGTGSTAYTAMTGAGTAAHTAAGASVCN